MTTAGPRSVAIIMDGNGRWARQRGLVRVRGHRAGAQTVDRITEEAARLGVKYLTLYAFSTENWQRPKNEVVTLWDLLVRDLRRRAPKCLRQGIRLTAIGRRDRMPPKAARQLAEVEAKTAHCERMTLCLALDYGGTWDFVQMAERIRQLSLSGELLGPVTETDLTNLLPSGQVPPVDLLIRTGGESRVSNFLPWQLTYAELLFLPKLWPDFEREDLISAFEEYTKKHRRFGRIEEEPVPAGSREPS